MAHPTLLLTREELWVLARALGGEAFPGIPFDDLNARAQEAGQTLPDLLERILWARGVVARDQKGHIHVRRQAWELLYPGLFPSAVYFYGQRYANGQEDVVFFYQNDRGLVACAQLIPGVYQFVALPDPQWMLRIVGAGMELPRYENPPPNAPPLEVPVHLLASLERRIREAPEDGDAHRTWAQTQGATIPEATWPLFLETFQAFQKYHALTRLAYPEVRQHQGFAFLQSPRYLWCMESHSEMRRLQLVDADFALQRLQALFLGSSS